MLITMPDCKVLGTETFKSREKKTPCGVLRWYDQLEGAVYRTMVFNDDVALLEDIESGMICSVVLELRGSRRDDTAEVYLSSVSVA